MDVKRRSSKNGVRVVMKMENKVYKNDRAPKRTVNGQSEKGVKKLKDAGKWVASAEGTMMEGAVVAALFNLATTNLENHGHLRDEFWKMVHLVNDLRNSGFEGVSFNIEVGNPSRLTFIFPKLEIMDE